MYDECRTELCANREGTSSSGVACERFHQYTYGRDITVQSDHKPLEAVTNKPLACAPPRLQRMLLRLQRYNVKVVYVTGKKIPLADTLSRIFVKIEPKLPRHDMEDSVRVQRYNVKVVYVPGKQIPLADTLSRIFVKIEPKLPRHDLENSVRVHETLTTSDLSE